MAFLGGITWKHSNYHGNARSMIPLNLGCDSFHLELPKNMRYLSSPEYADVVEVFMPFLNQEKFGEPDILKTLKVVQHYKDVGSDKFREKNYLEAFKLYQCSWKLLELLAKQRPELQSDIVLLLSNLSATCSKLAQGEDALDFAEQCIKADPSFVKGYFRRAEARKTIAADVDDEEECKEVLTLSMHDLMKCYEKMTDEDDQPSRLRQYCESVKMAVVLGGTKYLPEIHKADQPLILLRILEYITTEIQPEIIKDILDYLLFKRVDSKWSGLAHLYPSDCSSISIQPFITYRVLTMERLAGLRRLKFVVTDEDIILALEMENTDNIMFWYLLVDMRCEYLSGRPDNHLTDVYDSAVKAGKIPFLRFLIVEHKAHVSKLACITSIQLLKRDQKILGTMFRHLTAPVRSKVFVDCFMKDNEPLLPVLFESGRLDFRELDLSKMMSSPVLLRTTDYFAIFLKYGAPTNGFIISVHPVTALNKSHMILEAKVEILSMLIEQGTDLKKLSIFYSDPMGPIHTVTKLGLETGNVDIIKATCVRYTFPGNGRLVDKNNRTPLHLAMLSDDMLLSIKILKELSKHNIDKSVKDVNQKRAQDYAYPHNDETRLNLVRYKSPEKGPRQTEASHSDSNSDINTDDIENFDDVDLNHHKKLKIVFSEKPSEAPPPNTTMFIDVSKFKVNGEYKPTNYGVNGQHKGKWVGDWAHFLCPYDPGDEMTQDRFQSVVQQMRNLSKSYIKVEAYEDAVYSYMQVINQYDIWEKTNPQDDVSHDKGMIYCNISLCLYKLCFHPDAITAAEEACSLVPKYYKAHYRRAAANQQYAESGIKKGHTKCIDANGKLEKAMQGYAMAYTLMSDVEQVNFRSQLVCDILIIGLDRGSQEFVPKFHEFDEPHIITKVIEKLVKCVDSPVKKCAYIEVILVKSKLQKSGFGAKYPCTFTNLSYIDLLPHPTFQLLKALLSRNYMVTLKDLKGAVELFTQDKIEHVKLLTEGFGTQKKFQQATTEICNMLIYSKKFYFVPFFLEIGAEPSPYTIIEVMPYHELDNSVAEYVAFACDSNFRTKVLHKCLSTGSKYHINVLLNSGRVIVNDINLSDHILSPILLRKPEIVEDLIKVGVSSLGSTIQRTPLSVLFASETVSSSQLVRVGEILITHGASIDDLKVANEEKMTPVHIATKLALETGNIDFLRLVCSKTDFPPNGRVIDNHTQTPLHLAFRAKYNNKSTQVCEVLCKYCIDPKIKDKWNKTAQEYCHAKNDKRVLYLKKAVKTMGDEMSKSSLSLPVEDVNRVVEEESAGKKKKKKRKRNRKKEECVEETVDDEDGDDGGDDGVTDEVQVPVVKEPVRPVEQESHTISSLLVTIMNQCDEYFISLSSANTSFQQIPTDATESNHDNMWISKEIEPLKLGRYSKDGCPDDDPLKSIDDQPWEVECTENVIRFLKNEKCPFEIRSAAVERISSLASGKWLSTLQKPISVAFGNTLYEAELATNACILWDVSVQFSAKCTSKDIGKQPLATRVPLHVFSEVIRIWDVVPDAQQKDLCVQHIVKSRDRGLKATVNINLLPQFLHSQETFSKHNLPKKFLVKQGDSTSDIISTTKNPYSLVQRFCPAASTKEDEFNVFVFYNFSSDLVSCILGGVNIRRDFPFKEWPKEHDIINLPHCKETVLLVGRSGTGKTTCCLYRLWYQFYSYWMQASIQGPCYPRRPLTFCLPSSQEAASSSKNVKIGTVESEFEHLHQIFVTKNYVLCSQMKKRFYDMAASYPHLTHHLEYESQTDPIDLMSVHNMAYPLFLTSRQFLLILDASLENGTPFFPRNKDRSIAVNITSSDYNNENPDTFLDIEDSDDEDSTFDEGDTDDIPLLQAGGSKSQTPIWREVTAVYFINDIWPKISAGSNNIDPLLVWIEIKSFIKGSAQAVETTEGHLTERDYLTLGKKMASNFVGNREEMYKIFLRYENFLQKKRSLNLFDECQLVHNIYQRLITMDCDPSWSIHNFYIDEVQDFTQAELSVLIQSCREPNDLFLTGDTAQSIMRGIAFRFSDLRSLFHYANERSSRSVNPITIKTPVIHDLTINFRSHSGVLQLAASVIDLLKKFFPNSFDTLPEDRGMFPGPLPVFLQSCQTSDLALLLQSNKRVSSTIEFGAHQVIIVQNEQSKENLPDVLKAGIVLTVFESKGLEFDDVLLYNFFSNSPVDKEWRVVTSYADQFHSTNKSISLENKPRPLEFNEQTHKSLNSELKYLYTAVTRAKCNLWIYDSNKDRRLPIFDYWVRRGLVKVVRIGEKEEEDQVLFTATSTPAQWQQQGNYFKRKGLWEPAMKCYHKANMTLLEKESEAYMFAQKAKLTKNPREIVGSFDNAARAFLTCDNLCHDVKFLINAAKCLRNSKKHLEAAKLFEKLGESELAKRSYIRAKDHTNVARIRETEGDYSGAVRVLVRANRRLQALESSQAYEKQGHVLEIDVSSFQLANQYAKFFISRRDEINLSKVLSYIDDPFVRVGHLKKGRLYQMALDEYLKSGKIKEAVELILAQEMYDQGTELANGRKEVKKGITMGSLFKLHKATALLYHTRNSKGGSKQQPCFTKMIEMLSDLGQDNEPVARAKARLLLGVIEEKPLVCQEAMNMYRNEPLNDVIGSLEAFNEMVKLRKTDCAVRTIANLCFQAKEIASLFVSKSPKGVQIQKLAIQFYHLSHLENVYLLPKSQDIWIGNLHGVASIKEQPLDENGMIRLEPERVHKALSTRFSNFVREWIEKTALVKRLKDSLSVYKFNKDLTNDLQIIWYQEGFPYHLTTDYIENINVCMRLSTIIPGSFDNRILAKLVPNTFSPYFTFPVPILKGACGTIHKCSAIQESLKSDIEYFLEDRSLSKPNVNELFDAWRCSCLINSVDAMEKKMEDFAGKKGPGTVEQEKSKAWLFVDKKGKPSYHYFFSYLLKAYCLVRESCQVIGSMKIIFNCFLAVIARRPVLRKKTSMYNLINVITICSTALIALLEVNDPNLSLLVPYYYKNQCKLFDDLNIQKSNQFFLLTACVRQIHDAKNDRLPRLVSESSDLLCKLLSYIIGVYSEHYNILDMIINGKDEHLLVHCLAILLVLLSNVRMISDEHSVFVSESLEKMESILRLGIKQEVRLSSCLKDYYSQLSQLNTVSDTMTMIQVILSKYKYPLAIARLHTTKSGNMEFKEINLPQQLHKIRIRVNREPTPPIATPIPDPPSTEDKPVNINNGDGNVISGNNPPELQSIPPTDAVLQTLQQQLMFILQQKHQLERYRLLLNQQLLSLQQTPLDNLALYQQQLLHLRQQQYQSTEAYRQLELQHQQINLKMLHYSTQKQSSQLTQALPTQTLPPQVLPTQMFPSQALPTQTLPPQAMSAQTLPPQTLSPQMFPSQALPTQTLPPQVMSAQTLPPQTLPPQMFPQALPSQMFPHQALSTQTLPPQALPTQMFPSQALPTQTIPNQVLSNQIPPTQSLTSHILPNQAPGTVPNGSGNLQNGGSLSNPPAPVGITIHNNINGGVSRGSVVGSKRDTDEDMIDDEMEHLLVRPQSGFFGEKEIQQSSPSIGGGEDNELVDQYYCQVCGVSFKTEGSETNLEDNHETSLASMFHNTNFETYAEHVKSQPHLENCFSHSQFISFKQQVYAEPRKQLDDLLDDTTRIESANLERSMFYIRSKLREFDQEIEDYKDAYKWRLAHSRTVTFVEEMIALSRQLMKKRAVESVKMVPLPNYTEHNLANMVFIDDEDDYGIEGIDVKSRDAKKKKKNLQKK